MKSLLFILLSAFYAAAYAQANKQLSHTSFVVGDLIECPKMLFYLGGGNGVIREHHFYVEQIADFLKLHPNLEIEIGAHSCSRDTDERNSDLTARRAMSVKHLLVEFGIDESRISTVGYGESKLLILDEEISKISDSAEREKRHSINRRVDLKILKVN